MEEPCETSALNFLQPKVVGVHYTFGPERGLGIESYARLVSGHHPPGSASARGNSARGALVVGPAMTARMAERIPSVVWAASYAHLLSGHHPAPRLRRKSGWGWAADDQTARRLSPVCRRWVRVFCAGAIWALQTAVGFVKWGTSFGGWYRICRC